MTINLNKFNWAALGQAAQGARELMDNDHGDAQMQAAAEMMPRYFPDMDDDTDEYHAIKEAIAGLICPGGAPSREEMEDMICLTAGIDPLTPKAGQ